MKKRKSKQFEYNLRINRKKAKLILEVDKDGFTLWAVEREGKHWILDASLIRKDKFLEISLSDLWRIHFKELVRSKCFKTITFELVKEAKKND